MRNLHWNALHQGFFKRLIPMLFGLVILATAGCDTDDQDAAIINEILLPTDLLLNLSCENAGINDETCVLEDSENPYRTVILIDFDENDPDDLEPPFENLFPLNNDIPVGPTGAKARFYLWATALARRNLGTHQWYTARALHELWTAQVDAGAGDPLIQAQALKAYRSVLDNFFFEATFFSTCDFAPCPPNDELIYAVQVKDLTGQDLVEPETPTYMSLFPGPAPFPASFDALDTMATWGYGYELPNPAIPADNGNTFKFAPPSAP